MLRSLNDLLTCKVAATDGELGTVNDFYFDDWEWCVRYAVVDTGVWLPGRRVLIAPTSIEQADWAARRLHVNLTRKQVETSPGIDSDERVSRQMEADLAKHFLWPTYWTGRLHTPPTGYKRDAAVAQATAEHSTLRSADEVIGYYIEATDDSVGHVEDFILDDEDWKIRYLVVDTRNWLPGKKVLVAPEWVRSVRWDQSRVHVDLTRGQVQSAPEYSPAVPINRDYETRLYEFYGRSKYWEDT